MLKGQTTGARFNSGLSQRTAIGRYHPVVFYFANKNEAFYTEDLQWPKCQGQ